MLSGQNPKKRIKALYSLLCEGYGAGYNPIGGPDRMIMLENGIWLKASAIKEILNDDECYRAIHLFQRYQLMGLPYGFWGNNPNKLVELVELLMPLDQHYHPRII